MNFKFNEAQLSRPQRESLRKVLDVLQLENENELEVTVVEFPFKLKVKLDDDIEMLLGWDTGNQSYAGLTTPERLESDIKDLAKETMPESKQETVDLPGPESLTETKLEPELDLAPVIERAKALVRAFVELTVPLDTDQRLKLWIECSNFIIKEILE